MADVGLTARPPLGVDPVTIDGLEAGEVGALSIVSIATPIGGEDLLKEAISSAFDADLPAVGQSARSGTAGTLFLGLQPGQYFALFGETGEAPLDVVRNRIGETAYLTDQSDGWALVRVGGPRSREALARLCPVDLHPDRFAAGSVTRTLMDHLSVIILREEADTFLLMSARSSARSFWHAIETSIRNIA